VGVKSEQKTFVVRGRREEKREGGGVRGDCDPHSKGRKSTQKGKIVG